MKKKVLIVDDSALMRRVFYDIINADERFQVEDVAKNGLEALNLILEKKYDAIVCDINMPKMTGLELLEALHRYKINANILMASTLTREGASETIRALELGASDFITKPENFIEAKGNDFKTHFMELLSAITKFRTIYKEKKEEILKPVLVKRDNLIKKDGKKIIAIACSTGGPRMLHMLIPKLPPKLGVPVLIVQHMPGGFTKSLAERLHETSKVNVKEAEEGDELIDGNVYIAPGGMHMKIKKNGIAHKINLTKEEPREGVRPCANYMYESLGESSYEEVICVILTGMGQDGTQGIKNLKKQKNVYVIAQDKDSSVVYGMPKAVTEAGLVNEIQPIEKIADAIINYLGV